MLKNTHIRHAALSDLDAVAALEARCFPPAEAAARDTFAMRLAAFPRCLWLLEAQGQLCAMIGGMTTDEETLSDAMYEGTALYRADGAWLMVFGVATEPAMQHKGLACALMRYVIGEMQAQERRGIVLTCKAALLPFYAQFGFVNEGVSGSVHGGAEWYQMRLDFAAHLERCILRGEECRFRRRDGEFLLYGWEQCDGYILTVTNAADETVWQTAPMSREDCAAAFRAFCTEREGSA